MLYAKSLTTHLLQPGIIALLMLALFTPPALCQELTIYAIPPKEPLNWQSPQTLMLSYAGNLIGKTKYKGRRHAMGHVVVELKNKDQYVIAGMIAASKANMYSKVVVQGYGLGAMFEKINGTLEQGSELAKEIEARCQNGDVAWMRFTISEAAFARLWQYMEEYQGRGYDKIYNGDNKPREGGGSGCSAFGVSFLELAGLMTDEEMSGWLKLIYVPQSLIGYKSNNGTKRIPPVNILLKRTWADTSGQSYRPIAYYEPELMYRWILNEWDKASGKPNETFQPALAGKARGVVRDGTAVPVPSDPIWKDAHTLPQQAMPVTVLPGRQQASSR